MKALRGKSVLTLVRAACRVLLLVLKPLIDPFERPKVMRHGRVPLRRHQPVFIVGAPRTGSTILYQVLTAQCDVLYISNLIDVFYRDLYFGFWLNNALGGRKPHRSFRSSFGNTLDDGLFAPSESGVFWLRWMPKDRDFAGRSDLAQEAIEAMRTTVASVINRYGKPLLVKNLNMGQRMGTLSEAFPGAKFIFIKRDPVFTAQSIWQSKRKLGIGPEEWWSVRPRNYRDLMGLDEIERIVKQIYFVERQITADMRLFSSAQSVTVRYEQFCEHTERTVALLKDFLGADVCDRERPALPPLTLNNKPAIPENELALIREHVHKLDWDRYGIT